MRRHAMFERRYLRVWEILFVSAILLGPAEERLEAG
jgi:hypothetical protein